MLQFLEIDSTNYVLDRFKCSIYFRYTENTYFLKQNYVQISKPSIFSQIVYKVSIL